MKVQIYLFFISCILLALSLVVSSSPKNETSSTRFVFTYNTLSGSDDINLPQFKSFDEYVDYLADQLNVTWSRIKNYTIAGLNFQVGEMAPVLAEAISQLPFIKSFDRDVPMQVSKPLLTRTLAERAVLAAEEIPYGISMVGALNVSDEYVGNRVVCIIDSGYDDEHPDLPHNATGTDFGAGPWNQDGQGSGTHAAGTILALGGNGQGVVGVNRNGKIGVHVVRMFDDTGAAWASDYVEVLNSCVENGANVVYMGFGREEDGPLEFERTALKQFYDDGLLLVAPAGNHGTSHDSWPASYESVISATTVDENKQVALFSPFNNQVEFAAPGVGVLSTMPGAQYAYLNGTSAACAHVSGVAALVWSHFPEKNSSEIRHALQQSAEDLGVSGRDVEFGFGLVRADLAYNFLNEGNSGTPVPTPVQTLAPTDIKQSTNTQEPNNQEVRASYAVEAQVANVYEAEIVTPATRNLNHDQVAHHDVVELHPHVPRYKDQTRSVVKPRLGSADEEIPVVSAKLADVSMDEQANAKPRFRLDP